MKKLRNAQTILAKVENGEIRRSGRKHRQNAYMAENFVNLDEEEQKAQRPKRTKVRDL